MESTKRKTLHKTSERKKTTLTFSKKKHNQTVLKIKEQLLKDKQTFFSSKEDYVKQPLSHVKFCLFKLPLDKRILFEEIIFKAKTENKNLIEIFTGIFLPNNEIDEEFIHIVSENIELFLCEGNIFPHFEENGQLKNISPIDTIDCLFVKCLYSQQLKEETIGILREIIDDEMIIEKLIEKFDQATKDKNEFQQKMVFEIAKEWHLYHQKYMHQKQRKLLERSFIPMYTEQQFKEKSLKEIVLEIENTNDVISKTKRKRSRLIFDIYDTNPMVFATQLFLYDYRLLKEVSIGEFLKDDGMFGFYKQFIQMLGEMVKNSLQNDKDSKHINFWIQVCYECFEIGEYQSSFMIAQTLQSKNNLFLNKLTFDYKRKYESIISFFELNQLSSQPTYSQYKQTFEERTIEKIPVICTFLTAEIERINGVSKDSMTELQLDKYTTEKMKIYGNCIKLILQCQQQIVLFEPNEEILTFLYNTQREVTMGYSLKKINVPMNGTLKKLFVQFKTKFGKTIDEREKLKQIIPLGQLSNDLKQKNIIIHTKTCKRKSKYYMMQNGFVGISFNEWDGLKTNSKYYFNENENNWYSFEIDSIEKELDDLIKNETDSKSSKLNDLNKIKEMKHRIDSYQQETMKELGTYFKQKEFNDNGNEIELSTEIVTQCIIKDGITMFLFSDNTIQIIFNMNVKEMISFAATISYFINIDTSDMIVIHDINKKEYISFAKNMIQKFDGNVDNHFILLENLLRNVLDK